MHVERDRDEVVGDGLADGVPLLVGRELEEFLAEVVSEGIWKMQSSRSARGEENPGEVRC